MVRPRLESPTPHHPAQPAGSFLHPADTAIPSAGILTLDGSFLAETVNHVDRTYIQFGETKLERQTVNTLFLRSLSIFETRELIDKPAGVLRIDGTFTEGKLLRVDKETVTLSNILFGLKTLKRAASTPWRSWSIPPSPLIPKSQSYYTTAPFCLPPNTP